MKQTLPNAVATLVLGICSIVFGCMYVGLVLGIIGLVISGSSVKLYRQNPEQWDGYGMLNAGRVMSIIGVVLAGIWIVWLVFAMLLVGAAGVAAFPWAAL